VQTHPLLLKKVLEAPGLETLGPPSGGCMVNSWMKPTPRPLQGALLDSSVNWPPVLEWVAPESSPIIHEYYHYVGIFL